MKLKSTSVVLTGMVMVASAFSMAQVQTSEAQSVSSWLTSAAQKLADASGSNSSKEVGRPQDEAHSSATEASSQHLESGKHTAADVANANAEHNTNAGYQSSHSDEQPTALFQTTEELDQYISEYLIKNPSVVIDAINAYQAQEAERQQLQMVQSVRDSYPQMSQEMTKGVSFGSTSQPYVVVEFMDPLCGYCKKLTTELDKVNNAHIVVKPLAMFNSSKTDLTLSKPSLAVLAAYDQMAKSQPEQFKNCYKDIMSAPFTAKNIDAQLADIQKKYTTYGADFSLETLKKYVSELDANKAAFTKFSFGGTPAMIVYPKGQASQAYPLAGYVDAAGIQQVFKTQFKANEQKQS